MTKTWQQIRQELSRRVQEPIMRRVGTEVVVGGSTSTLNFYSTAMAHLTNQWGVQYGTAYVSSTTDGLAPLGQELEIQDFLTDGSTAYAYVQPTGFYPALAAGDKVEIHEFFTARQLLDAVNQAIRDAWPAFYRMTRDETVMLRKFKRQYDLTALAVRPRHIVGAYVEPIFRVGIGTGHTELYLAEGVLIEQSFLDPLIGNYAIQISAVGDPPVYNSAFLYEIEITSGDGAGKVYHVVNNSTWSSDTLWVVAETVTPALKVTSVATIRQVPHQYRTSTTIPAENDSALYTPGLNWPLEANKVYEVAIYYGTGAGQFRTIEANDSGVNGFFITTPWATTPDSTSEFMVKNMSDVYYNWLGPLAKVRYDQDESPTLAEILYDTYELWGARLRFEYASPLSELTTETSTIPDDAEGYIIPRAMYYLFLQNVGRSAQFDVKTAATLADQYQKEADEFRDRNRMKRLGGTIRTDAQYMNWSDREMPFKR